MRIRVVASPYQVIEGQQDLADGDPVSAECVGVARHEQALPHTGSRLLRRELVRSPWESKRSEARCNCARGDKDDLGSFVMAGSEHIGQGEQRFIGESSGERREGR